MGQCEMTEKLIECFSKKNEELELSLWGMYDSGVELLYDIFIINENEDNQNLEECIDALSLMSLSKVSSTDELFALYIVSMKDLETVERHINNGSYTYNPATSLAEIAGQYVDEGMFGEISETLLKYIDLDALAEAELNDWELTDYGCILVN